MIKQAKKPLSNPKIFMEMAVLAGVGALDGGF